MTIIREEPAPRSPQSAENIAEHVVQFYETDDFLIDALARFVGGGLSAGDTCLVIATPAHRQRLEQRLRASGLDLVAAQARGHYSSWDAASTLARFMANGAPDPARFTEIIGGMVTRAASAGRPVRIFGEMVALLWATGNHTAAIRLEALWNELPTVTHPFSLRCAYPMRSFAGEAHRARFDEICRQHSHVIPDEPYTTLTDPDEQLRAITLLQQKAISLEAEIAERKQIEAALRASEERWRLLAESMPQKIFTAQPNGEVDYFNPQWMHFTGLSFDEIRGWGWTQFVHPDDVAENVARWRSSIETGEPFYFEQRFRRADGVYRWHISRAIPMRDSGGRILMWVGSNTDTDEQKQLEGRKNAFISMASHELKTPVTSLMSFTQILQRRLNGQADPQSLRFLDRMEAQLKKLAGLISDLLDISKMQTGALDFRESSIDLDDLVRETVENLQAATPTHQLTLQGVTHARVYGDRDRLEQVLINLLTNAIKYSPQADSVVVCLRREHQQVEVAVRDFGIGIAPDFHERIFERFYQVTGRQESTYPGLGIGLYIARVIIERHGGRLWLESQPGAGSTFRFTLPVLNAGQKTPAPSARTEEECVS